MRSEDVQGRWKSILPCFGISGRFLVNKHGPCPMCGGRDRFRFDDIEGNGTWICNQCGAGNGFTMLKLLYGWEFQEALKKIGEAVVLGVNGDQEQPKPAEVVDDDARHEAHMRVLRGCRKITTADPAGQYLEGRGIPAQLSDSLLYHPALYNHDERMDVPAMIAPIMSIDGKLLSLHRTFLLPNGVSRKIMPPVGTITGGAVHLFEPGEVLGVAEGIETALCAHLRFGTPTWACISAHGLESVEIPEGVSHVVIYGDNDGSYTGQKAAYVLAHRLVTRDHLDVLVVIPKQIGLDWADARAD